MDGPEKTQQPAPPAAGPSSLDDLVNDHLRRVEAPDADTVAHEQKKLAEELGPDVQKNPDGTPKMHATLNRPKLKTGPSKKSAEERAAEEAAKREKTQREYHYLGLATAQTIFLVCTMIGGEEFKPSADEADSVAGAWAHYYEAKGISDVPPELHLAGAMLAYVGPRLLNPEVRSRIKKKLSGGTNGQA